MRNKDNVPELRAADGEDLYFSCGVTDKLGY